MSVEREARPVPRPSIPPLVWATAGVWAGISLAEALTWRSYIGGAGTTWLLVAGPLASTVAAGLLFRARWAVAALVSISLCAGLILGAVYWTRWSADVASVAGAGGRRWEVEVLTDEVEGAFGASSQARILGPTCVGSTVSLQWPRGCPVPETGRRVEVFGTVQPLANDQWGRRAHQQGSRGSLRARLVRVQGWASSMRGAIGPLRAWAIGRVAEVPGVGGDLVAGVVLGDRRRLTGTAAETDFRTTGLTHLVAVSGSHLVVVAAVAGWALAALRVGRLGRSTAVAALVGAYVVFSGVQPSAVRAWVMAVAASAAWASERRSDGSATLAVAALTVLLVSPVSAYDLGFRLSVLAVAGLVLFARLGEAWISTALPRWLRWLAGPLSLTLAATASTLPLTVSTFNMVSLVSPVANLAAGPMVSVALVLGLAGLALAAVWTAAGRLALYAAGSMGALSAATAGWLASWPYAAVPATVSPMASVLVCGALAASCWAVWPAPSRRRARCFLLVLVMLVVACAVGPRGPSGPRIVVLDVGQGDAILVRDGGHTMLVDAGPSAGVLREALARVGVRRLDRVVVSHLHADHDGGLSALDGLVPVAEIGLPAGALSKDSPSVEAAQQVVGEDAVRELATGTRIDVGSLEVEVVSPLAAVQDASANDSSVVLRVRKGRFCALLTGDAESDVLGPLVADGTLGDVDVVKVGHHGSAGAVSDAVLATLRPEWALISVGAGNRFGHPTASTLAELARSGSNVVRTDQRGDITVEILETGCRVLTARRLGETGVVLAEGRRGIGPTAYATLSPTRYERPSRATRLETHGQGTVGIQAGLPHLRGTGPPARAGPRQAQERGRPGGGPRFQHGDLRG